MTLTFEDVDVTEDSEQDSLPPLIDIEYPCTVCGAEAGPYRGRGRKPTKCPAHKQVNTTSTKVKGANAALASQAVEVLCQVNNVLTMPCFLFGFPMTASAIAKANGDFREQAYNALLIDPKLASSIVRGGTKGGGLALAIAYAMLGSQVAPVMIVEYKTNRPVEGGDE